MHDVGIIPPKVDKYSWPPIFIGGLRTTAEPQPETGWIKSYSIRMLALKKIFGVQPVPGCFRFMSISPSSASCTGGH